MRGCHTAAPAEDRQCTQQPAGSLCCTESVHMLPLLGKMGPSLYGDNVYSEQENRRSKAIVTGHDLLEHLGNTF